MKTFTRWDGISLAIVLVFGISIAIKLNSAPSSDDDPIEQLADLSHEIQLGEEWLGLFFRGERVGLVHIDKAVSSTGGYSFSSQTNLRLSAFGTTSQLNAKISARVDTQLNLESVDFNVRTGPARFEGRAVVVGKTLEVVMNTGRVNRKLSLPFERPPVLRSLVGPALSKTDLIPGKKIKMPVFDPVTQKNQDMIVTVVGPDTVLVLDRPFPAIHIRQSIGGLVLNGWINERGEMLRQELGLGLVAVRETKARARSGTLPSVRGANLVDATMISVSGLPKSLERRTELAVELSGIDIAAFTLNDQRQTWKNGRLTIRKESIDVGLKLPVDPQKYKEELKAKPLIQSDNPRIRDTAKTITAGAQDTVDGSRRIFAWMAQKMTQKPVAGIPSALETLDTLVGDCNEHSTLFAALARASGIPTRMVIGLVYKDGRFGYHAWNEVATAKGWLSIDTTWGQIPADVGHIALLRGGLSQQLRLLPLMGRLKISTVENRQ